MPRRSRRNAGTPQRLTYNQLGTPAPATYFLGLFLAIDPVVGRFLINAARSTDPDTLTFDEAMRDDESNWMHAAEIEVKALEKHRAWDEVSLTDATSKILPGTWVFRRKRTPDGTIRKLKARYCVRGDLQEGSFETYAPVAIFSSVRLFLFFSTYLQWFTCSIDFSSAFIQARFKNPIWVNIPRGFGSLRPGKTFHCLKRSCYGIAAAPRLWFLQLFEALESLGFARNPIDPCLLMTEDCFIILFMLTTAG